MVGVVVASDYRSFHDSYDITEDDSEQVFPQCEFKCRFKPQTLYYAYLLSQLVIITSNTYRFCLVLRASNNRKKVHVNSKSLVDVRNLVAAVSMLVLLGTKWIFAGFGALESDSAGWSSIEGIFHIVFVVFVLLQGLFIFVFHCMRNDDISC